MKHRLVCVFCFLSHGHVVVEHGCFYAVMVLKDYMSICSVMFGYIDDIFAGSL